MPVGAPCHTPLPQAGLGAIPPPPHSPLPPGIEGMSVRAAAPVRSRTEEEVQAEMAEVQGMWEMASVLEFLHTFSADLDVR